MLAWRACRKDSYTPFQSSFLGQERSVFAPDCGKRRKQKPSSSMMPVPQIVYRQRLGDLPVITKTAV